MFLFVLFTNAWNLFCLSEFLVSELQAARIIKHKESRPEEKTTEEESEKEQRVEDPSHELAETCEEYGDNDCTSKAEMQAEWVLTLHALDMDTSSKFTDVLSEVRLMKDRSNYA